MADTQTVVPSRDVVSISGTRAALSAEQTRTRLQSLDLLRGVVMVLMALDHVRDYWGPLRYAPDILSQTTPGVFFTRWVTHFCAPVFVFLAGTSAYLYAARGRGRGQVSRFLLTRGVWLIVLEFTVVFIGWNFTYRNGWPGGPSTVLFAQVIWVIGCSMIVLAGLVWLPISVVAAFGVMMIVGHNLLDTYNPASPEWLATTWTILHRQRLVVVTSRLAWFNIYPLIPWIGVIAVGYAFGMIAKMDGPRRRRWCLSLGVCCTLAFVALRAVNGYGEPQRWQSTPPGPAAPATSNAGVRAEPSAAEQSTLYGLMSFLNCTKYPPSLQFLLMTLGPAFVALVCFERAGGVVAGFFATFGRVPLFYYVLHIPLINATAALYFQLRFGEDRWFAAVLRGAPTGFEADMRVVYVAWIVTVLSLYPVCRWFAGLKQRRRSWWLSYL